jgi:transposase InsO family protein
VIAIGNGAPRSADCSDIGRLRLQTPFRAPNCNAHAERFVRSIKEECLDRLIPLGERHFRRARGEFVVHYHRERNHQGLANELIDAEHHQRGGRFDGASASVRSSTTTMRRRRRGGEEEFSG